MASVLDAVLANFRTQIEAISPTNSKPGRGFKHADPKRLDPSQSSGATRTFAVIWLGSEQDGKIEGKEIPTDMTERWAEHAFSLRVAYSTDYALDLLQEIVAQDRHDIAKRLRNPDYFCTGLHARVRIEDKLDRENAAVWYLDQTWQGVIQETEI